MKFWYLSLLCFSHIIKDGMFAFHFNFNNFFSATDTYAVKKDMQVYSCLPDQGHNSILCSSFDI